VAAVLSPPISVHQLLTAWQHDPISLTTAAVEIALVAAYLAGVHRLARRGRHWPGWRTIAFVAGIATVVVAVQSGVASYDDSNFTVHVVQHLLLMNVAPIFLALAAPMTLALQASRRANQERLLKVLHHPVISFFTHPLVAAGLSYATMIGYFLTPFYNFSLEHPVVHDLTHLHFLLSGCLFWWVVVGKDPSRWRPSYPVKLGLLAVGVPVTAVLGVALSQARTSIAPHFHTVTDTRAGGSILWIFGELTTLLAMGVVLYQWLSFDEREQARADRRVDQALADPQPAAPPPENAGLPEGPTGPSNSKRFGSGADTLPAGVTEQHP
jgi:putative membrane protein